VTKLIQLLKCTQKFDNLSEQYSEYDMPIQDIN